MTIADPEHNAERGAAAVSKSIALLNLSTLVQGISIALFCGYVGWQATATLAVMEVATTAIVRQEAIVARLETHRELLLKVRDGQASQVQRLARIEALSALLERALDRADTPG